MASDGIFEVLKNEQIEHELSKCYKESSFEGSANLIVEKASQQWKKESNGQDDITIIIAFFEWLMNQFLLSFSLTILYY